MNSSSRCLALSRCESQYSVIGSPCTSSITKYGSPRSVAPASNTFAMSVVVHQRQRLALGFEARDDLARVHPALMILSATRRRTGPVCAALYTIPIPPSPSTPRIRYGPIVSGAGIGDGRLCRVVSCHPLTLAFAAIPARRGPRPSIGAR